MQSSLTLSSSSLISSPWLHLHEMKKSSAKLPTSSSYFPSTSSQSQSSQSQSNPRDNDYSDYKDDDCLRISSHKDAPVINIPRNVRDRRYAPSRFPANRNVLWNRSGIEPPHYVDAKDIIPVIYLNQCSKHSLLMAAYQQQIEINTDRHMNRISNDNNRPVTMLSRLVSSKDINPQQIGRFAHRMPHGVPLFVYSLASSPIDSIGSNAEILSPVTVSVPIELSREGAFVPEDLRFVQTTQSTIVTNLMKMAQQGSEFSLRSMCRLRGLIGEVACIGAGEERMLEAPVKFQAIIPLVSFQFVRILALPLLVPVPNPAASGGTGSVGYTMGFITLDETRKLVPLAHSDPNVELAPIVGVWINLPRSLAGQLSRDSNVVVERQKRLLNNPFIHAACTRFLVYNGIRDRVFVSEETFLLAIFDGAGEYGCYEVTRTDSVNASTNPDYSIVVNDKSDRIIKVQFTETEFSTVLTCSATNNNSILSETSEGIFCRLQATSYILSAAMNSSVDVPPDRNMVLPPRSPNSNRAKSTISNGSDFELPRDLTVMRDSDVEDDTPVPRNSAPPNPSPKSRLQRSGISLDNGIGPDESISFSSSAFGNVASAYAGVIGAVGHRIKAAGSMNKHALRSEGDIYYSDTIRLTPDSRFADVSQSRESYTESISLQTTFTAEVAIAQQKQISALQEQVESLQSMVTRLESALQRSMALSQVAVHPNLSAACEEVSCSAESEYLTDVRTGVDAVCATVNETVAVGIDGGNKSLSKLSVAEDSSLLRSTDKVNATIHPEIVHLLLPEMSTVSSGRVGIKDEDISTPITSRTDPDGVDFIEPITEQSVYVMSLAAFGDDFVVDQRLLASSPSLHLDARYSTHRVVRKPTSPFAIAPGGPAMLLSSKGASSGPSRSIAPALQQPTAGVRTLKKPSALKKKGDQSKSFDDFRQTSILPDKLEQINSLVLPESSTVDEGGDDIVELLRTDIDNKYVTEELSGWAESASMLQLEAAYLRGSRSNSNTPR